MTLETRVVSTEIRYPQNVGSAAKRVDDLVFVGAQLPVGEDDKTVAPGDVQEQARFALGRFQEALEGVGASLDDICEVQSFHTDPRDISAVLEVAKEFFGTTNKPTWSAVATTGLYKRAARVAFSGTAVVDAATRDINPGLEWYSEPPWDVAVPCKVANDLVFVGQMAGVDERGEVVAPGDLLAQSRYAMRKVVQCVEEAGGAAENVADIVLYCRDQRAQDTMFAATHDVFVKDPLSGPREGERYAGTSITQLGMFHPEVLGQYHAYAVLDQKRQIPLGKWIPYVFKYPLDVIWPAVKAGRYVFIAGQVMRDPKDTINDPSGELDTPGIKPQARFALYEMQQLLSFIGAKLDSVGTITAYHKDCRDMDAVLEVGHEFWHNAGPAWTSVGQIGLHVKQMLIEIYGIAIVDDDTYAPYDS